MDGYFTGVDYPARLIEQITPAHIAFAAARQGILAPDLSRPFRMLDIGCGTGAALVLAAASHPAGTFEGIDGMESHIRAGKALSEGIPNIILRHALFEQAISHDDAPCQLIVMHGVLSWAGASAREQAMDLAAHRIADGGLLAVSYNALPGSARLMTIQHVLRRAYSGAKGEPVARLHSALTRLREMSDAGFPALDPVSVRRLFDLVQDEPADYFMHEYLHEHWTPFWPDDIRRRLESRGLVRVGTLDVLRTRPDLCLTFPERQAAAGAEVAEADLMLDMALDSAFRSDLFARSPTWVDPVEARKRVWIGARRGPAGPLPSPEVRAVDAEPDRTATRALLCELDDRPVRLDKLASTPKRNDALDWLLIGGDAVAMGPPGNPGKPAAAINALLANAARLTGHPPIPALAGHYGPVEVDRVAMAVAWQEPDALLRETEANAVLRDLLFPAGEARDPSSLAHGIDRINARLARLGVVRTDD